MPLNKKDAIKIARSIEEFAEVLAHLRENNSAIQELKLRGDEINRQREDVLKTLDANNTMLAEIKAQQQSLVNRERELAALEHGIMDRLQVISDDTEAVLGKMASDNEE